MIKNLALVISGIVVGATVAAAGFMSGWHKGHYDDNQPWLHFEKFGWLGERMVVSDSLTARWAVQYFTSIEKGCFPQPDTTKAPPSISRDFVCSEAEFEALTKRPE